MANYTVIADISKTIVEMLRAYAVPEPIAKAEQIGTCSPQARGGYVVGIHPYDIKENAENRRIDPIVLPDGRLQNPPVEYTVYYMLSVVSKAEATTKSLDEQRIMGKVLQLLKDYATLPEIYMPEPLRMSGERLTISFLSMELEDKVKIWSMFNEPYQLCTFFSVSPITVDSSIIKTSAKRVTSIHFDAKQKDRGRS